MEVGEKIRRLIDRDGWPSVRSIATRAEVDDSTLDRCVRENRSMSVEKGIAVAGALGVPAEWLFNASQGWPPPASLDAPPISIVPWPPHGITWPEVKLAIAEYMARKAAREVPSNLADEIRGIVDSIEGSVRMGDYRSVDESDVARVAQALNRARDRLQGLVKPRTTEGVSVPASSPFPTRKKRSKT